MTRTRWIDIGEVADIPVRGARVVTTSRGDIAVFRAADDTVFALLEDSLAADVLHGQRQVGMIFKDGVPENRHPLNVVEVPEDFVSAIDEMLRQREMDPAHFKSLDEDYEEESHMEHFGVGSRGMDDG